MAQALVSGKKKYLDTNNTVVLLVSRFFFYQKQVPVFHGLQCCKN